jgi:hypothetical protein
MGPVFRGHAANLAEPARKRRSERHASRVASGARLFSASAFSLKAATTVVAMAIAMIVGSGCATVSAPVLKHATGETLGQKKFRVLGHYETSRIFAPGTPPEGTAGVAQKVEIFRGSFLGVQADGGVLPALDLQLGANFTSGGGGWRVGAKYQILKRGRFAVAGMAGYAAASGADSIEYLTDGTPLELAQTLSAYTFDVSIPASVRLMPWFVVYGGPMWLHSGAKGSLGSYVVNDTFNDFGASLGFQISYWIFTGGFEAAELLVDDRFTDTVRMIPYFGVSFGVMF